MVDFIDACRSEFGVEPICALLPIAPSSYYDAKSRPVSARARRHAAMTAVLVALWAANYRVYGARKLWLAARRAGHEIGRDQVAALMRAAGICGVTRRRRARTTVRDPGAERPGDLVNRDFTARSPNRLWVTDLTVAPTRTGAAYVCFIVDAFSRLIVGWRVATHMRTEMVLDRAAQYLSIRYSERLAELGAGAVGGLGGRLPVNRPIGSGAGSLISCWGWGMLALWFAGRYRCGRAGWRVVPRADWGWLAARRRRRRSVRVGERLSVVSG